MSIFPASQWRSGRLATGSEKSSASLKAYSTWPRVQAPNTTTPGFFKKERKMEM